MGRRERPPNRRYARQSRWLPQPTAVRRSGCSVRPRRGDRQARPTLGRAELRVSPTRIGWASGSLSEQVPLRGTLLSLGGAPAPEHGREAGVGHPALYLVGRQPVDVEFDAEAGAAAPAPDLAVTGLEGGHQIAFRLDNASNLAEGGRPAGRREV